MNMYRSVNMIIRRLFLSVLLVCLSVSGLWAEQPKKGAAAPAPEKGVAAPPTEKGAAAPAPAQKGLQQRIDFGNAQILGQSIKSGAVYLMHRKKSDIKNMLEVRKHYREEIKEDFGLEKTAISQSVGEPKNIPKQ